MNTPSTDITTNPMPSTAITAAGCALPPISRFGEAMPSVALPAPLGRWEGIGLWALVLTSPINLLVCHCLSEGRDLTVPFLAVNVLVLLFGIGLVALGWRTSDLLQFGIGALGCFLAIGTSGAGALGQLGCGFKEYTIEFTVTDEQTSKPIQNARVSLSAHRDNVRAATTGKDGKCEIPFAFFASMTTSLVCRVGGADFQSVWVEIDAEDYQSSKQRLSKLTRDGWPIYGSPPPPRIGIRLQPKR